MECHDCYIFAGWVAPHVGAWIEIPLATLTIPIMHVAPHVGAWIEISQALLVIHSNNVAPHVGAWIEILYTV